MGVQLEGCTPITDDTMINLLYHSHTVVPAHLEELSALEVLEPQEQVLAAIDGVLLDGHGQRVSGPTLHDYCLITDARIILWARDYAQHVCYAFPLRDVTQVSGHGVDPIHGALEFTFVTDAEVPQQFSLTLVAQAHLTAFVTLAKSAAATASRLEQYGVDAEVSAAEVTTVLGTLVYGSEDALPPHQSPYRWPGAEHREASAPQPGFHVDPAQLPPNTLFTAGRFARSAWDTLRRSLKDTDLPFDLSAGSVREFTEAVRAVNDLVQSVVSNPGAQQLAMAFIHRRQGGEAREAAAPAEPQQRPAHEPEPHPLTDETSASAYREIPLRRRSQTASSNVVTRPVEATPPVRPQRQQPSTPTPDRREIPLRRSTRPSTRQAATLSGSGDAERETGV